MYKNIIMNQRGLSNLGNTCYINATIQCLYHLKPFSDFLLKHKASLDKGITGKLIEVFEYLNNPLYKSIYLVNFINSFFATHNLFKKGEQNDSYIFLVSLLTTINKEIKNFCNNDIISKLFCNYIEEKTSYNDTNVDKEPSFCISIPIKNKLTLDQCLQDFQYNKSRYDNYTRKTYNEEIKILPTGKFLIFNLQRISEGRHLTNFVDYPEYLNFRDSSYELMGLIKHIGNEYSGHKVAICKDVNNWYEFDDDSVYDLSKQMPKEPLIFLLFYEKIENGFLNNEPEKKPHSEIISKNISNILDIYKTYEKEEKEKEKKINTFFEKIYNFKKIKNEEDFLKIFPKKLITTSEFQTIFSIKDIPEYFVQDYFYIDYFKLILNYKKIMGKKAK